jgi:hypothetical protein
MYTCIFCEGSGKCSECKGQGILTVGFILKTEKDCYVCEGLGLCNFCDGRGELSQPIDKINRVRCPKCGRVKVIRTSTRPLEIHCECETVLILKR